VAREVNAPFGRRVVALRNRRTCGRYVVLAAFDKAARAQPGQFYMLASAERWGGGEGERPYLGRAVSVMAAADDGLVEFLLEDVGPGTRRLCEMEVGEALAMVGPLGHGFAEPQAGADLLLVGGGIGIAPLVAVAQAFGGEALLGFRDAAHAAAAELLPGAAVATEDGSLGHHGLVTALLDERLAAAPASICACGPPAMLSAVRELAAAHGVASQLALEAPMACGFGACHGCIVATIDGYRRVCLDGPVFDGTLLE
jgi:NAD(P)H-flavin reductase